MNALSADPFVESRNRQIALWMALGVVLSLSFEQLFGIVWDALVVYPLRPSWPRFGTQVEMQIAMVLQWVVSAALGASGLAILYRLSTTGVATGSQLLEHIVLRRRALAWALLGLAVVCGVSAQGRSWFWSGYAAARVAEANSNGLQVEAVSIWPGVLRLGTLLGCAWLALRLHRGGLDEMQPGGRDEAGGGAEYPGALATRIDAWRSELSRALPPAQVRELESHLTELRERFVAEGLSESAALDRSIAQLGHPGHLVREFERANPQWVWAPRAIGILAGVLALGTAHLLVHFGGIRIGNLLMSTLLYSAGPGFEWLRRFDSWLQQLWIEGLVLICVASAIQMVARGWANGLFWPDTGRTGCRNRLIAWAPWTLPFLGGLYILWLSFLLGDGSGMPLWLAVSNFVSFILWPSIIAMTLTALIRRHADSTGSFRSPA